MNKQKVQAFTLMEVTVAMLISSLVIGITYAVYTIVVGSYSAYQLKSTRLAVLIRLDELLKKDFSQADLILEDQNSWVFKSAGQRVTYQLAPGYLVRISSITDTFKVSLQNRTASFETQPVTETAATEEEQRMDELQLNLVAENENITYHYHKQYSAVNLMQRKFHALN
jgi:prepilin-type N-terminal cleavage/methylation domain-containing protein